MRLISRRGLARLAMVAAAGLGLNRCAAPVAVEDAQTTLRAAGAGPRKHLAAMEILDRTPLEDQYLEALHEMIWRPGYTVGAREAAFERLVARDLESLKQTCRQRLPRISARAWQERLCELIADRGWVELSPALASSWARRIGYVDDMERAEYRALARLYGRDRVIDAVFETLVESNEAYQQGLRSRCWELLHRLGHRDRLVELLADQSVGVDDAMLADLRASAVDLGVVPSTREEILWLRKLREPERADFWSQASAVVAGLPRERRAELELRDLPILVAASIHDPWLLSATKQEIYPRVAEHLRATRLYIDPGNYTGYPGAFGQRLREHRDELTWGDLAAMLMAVRSAGVRQVAEHLFDYAERDRQDRSCEYGGIIALDDRGRFEILEFPPRFRRRDNEFIASQRMMDAGYTGVFHFHLHAQRYRNGRYAAPGIGDLHYADNTRANCLVFTFVNEQTLNVDFYRHGRVIVDLGEVKRP